MENISNYFVDLKKMKSKTVNKIENDWMCENVCVCVRVRFMT